MKPSFVCIRFFNDCDSSQHFWSIGWTIRLKAACTKEDCDFSPGKFAVLLKSGVVSVISRSRKPKASVLHMQQSVSLFQKSRDISQELYGFEPGPARTRAGSFNTCKCSFLSFRFWNDASGCVNNWYFHFFERSILYKISNVLFGTCFGMFQTSAKQKPKISNSLLLAFLRQKDIVPKKTKLV